MSLLFDSAIFDSAIFDPGAEDGPVADLSITWSNVYTTSTQVSKQYTAGEAFDAGQVVMLDETTNRLKKASGNGTANATLRGLALNKVAANQPCAIAIEGAEVYLGAAVMANGTFYYLSGNTGNLCTNANIASGNYISQIGYAMSNTTLKIAIENTSILA